MPPSDVDALENSYPGFTVQCIATETSWINARLRKRYGNSNGKFPAANAGNSLPWGQTPPLLIAAGTSPPTGLALVGTPILGSLMIGIVNTTPGPIGTAVFKYTINGGVTYTTGLTPVANVLSPLVGTGLSLQTPPVATFSSDNVYVAATPVPEVILRWLNALVTLDLYRRRGFNPQDSAGEMIVEAATQARAEVKEAADSESGLIDLPVSEDLDSAVTTGGPLGFSSGSPYAWQDCQAARGRAQDAVQAGGGGYGGGNIYPTGWYNTGAWSGIWGP
jgi:hypothetical protein